MASLLRYVLDDTTVTSDDGTHPITFDGATIVNGPGDLMGATYPKALALGDRAAGSVAIGDVPVDARRFRVHVVFRIDATFEGRQNLVESDRLPFALFLEGAGRSGIHLTATVNPAAHGWRGATSQFAAKVTVRAWHTADLVYDLDTVAVYLDGAIQSVHAFPNGHINPAAAGKLYVGSWVDGARNHFGGAIAAVQLDADIPAELESQLDERRSSAEWFISHKANELRPGLDLGAPSEATRFRSAIGAWSQRWTHGAFMYHPAAGAAFEMHGAIHARYQAIREADRLGYLVSDESVATDRRGRKSVFSKGAIYWSPQTGAWELDGQIYIDYENIGESRAFGFPKGAISNLPGGRQVELERARMYHRTGAPAAHEVHGEILRRFLLTGGTGKWGFPVSNETSVMKNGTAVGRRSEFEHATWYWSNRTGAFEVHGDIRRRYHELAGPAGELGFPTTDEMDVPGAPGARMNGFQQGSLCWYGSFSSIVHARPFKLFLASLNTDESEGFGMGQNDLYVKVTIKQGSTTLHDKKYPPSGDWGGRNVRDVNITLPPVITPDPTKNVTFVVDVWENDGGAPFGGGNDHLGKWTKVLNAANGWGLRENGGILDSGSFSKVNNIRASVKPQVDVRLLTETDRFWGTKNRSTPTISWAQYANAFRDVDSDTEWWDVWDGFTGIYYEAAVKGVANGGNCFGMSLEAIYARKDQSPFSLPLNRFTDWNVVKPTFNVKHQYQLGAAAIWWFVGEFLSGNTHDPVDVFNETRACAARGDHPVLCISQNYDFSGKPHCILPVSWDTSVTPWRMGILDPNFPNELRTLTVDPARNRYDYNGGNVYSGTEWTGGRMHYMPWSVLCEAPRTPVWDALALLLSGVLIIVGADHETASIQDAAGNDLDAHGAAAKRQLQAGGKLNGYFFSYRGFDGGGVIPGEVLLTKGGGFSMGLDLGGAAVDPSVVVNATIESLRDNRDLRRVHDLLVAAVEEAERSPGTVAGPVTTRGRTAAGRAVTRGAAASARTAAGRASSARSAASRALTEREVVSGPRSGAAAAAAVLASRTIGGRTIASVVADHEIMGRLDDAAREALVGALRARRTGDFVHEVRAKRNGALAYAVKNGLSEVTVNGGTATGQKTRLRGKDLGSAASEFAVRTDRDSRFDVSVRQKLGVAGDYVRVDLSRMPAARAAEVTIDAKPGLGAIDIVAGGAPVDVPITVTTRLKGREAHRRFDVRIEGGARLTVAPAIAEGAITVSQIDHLRGPVIRTRVIDASG